MTTDSPGVVESSPGGTLWTMARRELTDLWMGGRLLGLLVLYTVLLSVTSLLREVESQVNLIPPREMVFLTILSALSFGVLINVVSGADSVSGERERGTLEPVLLSPASRRQIIAAKFLAVLSPWPVAYLLSVPYIVVEAAGDRILGIALLWTLGLGTLLAIAFSALGMLISVWSRSNRTSLFISLLVYLVLLIPTQFPGEAQKGALGYTIQQLNPLQSTGAFIEKFFVNNRTPLELIPYLVSTVVAAIVLFAALFLYAAPRLTLEGGSPIVGSVRVRRRRAAAIGASGAALALSALLATTSGASAARPAFVAVSPTLTIEVDKEAAALKTGDEIEFTTTLTNTGTTPSPALVVAMNIINLGKGGDPVDPEDWSPERTQEVDPIDPGEAVEHTWSVEAILDGDYMVYLTAVPDPGGADATSQPVASPGIHLTVQAFQNTNPAGVLPVAIGMPIALVLVAFLLRRYWRRERTVSARAATTDGAGSDG